MKMTVNDLIEALPTLLASEPDITKREEMQKVAERFKMVRDRILLCDFHGIQVFEHKGQRQLELTGKIAQRRRSLEEQTPDSLREMVEDLTALAMMETLHVENILPPPEPEYSLQGLVNGEAFCKSAASIWAKTAVHRGFWEYMRTRMAPKLKPLYSSTGQARLKHATKLKNEFAAAIDVMVETGSRSHGAATLVDYSMPDGTSRMVTLPWLALRVTCTQIMLNLSPPTKGEVRKVIQAKWPKVIITDAAWGKVWKAAGLKWLKRKGNW